MFKQLTRTSAVLAAVATILSSAPAVLAEPIPSVFRDTQNNIYVTGQSPSSRVSMTYEGMLRSRDYQANSCGWIVLRNSTTSPIPANITVGGTAVDTTALATQLMPGCTNGVPQESRSANFKSTSGDVVIVGRTPGSYITVQTPVDRTRNATANACGVARFTNSTTYQHSDTTAIGLTQAPAANTIADLSEKDGVLCSRGSLYVPASWLAGGGS